MSYDNKTNTITTGRNADETDLIADLGLSWVYEMRTDAARQNAPSSIVADWKTLEAWLGCAGRELNQDDFSKIGDGFRAYVAKGKSPSAELSAAFRHLSQRTNAQDRVTVSIPPQIEKVFDRMLATDGEIQTKKALEPTPVRAAAPIGKVTHYANSKHMCCCSIKLVSGERVFISIAAAPTPSVKIMKMGLLGIFPVRTIWEYNPTMAGGYDAYLRKMMLMFQDPLAA